MLSMLPNSGIVAVNQPQADRFYYLSLAWLSLLLAWLVQRRVWLAGLVLVGLAGMLWQSHSYIAAWRSDGALWKHVYQQEPTHPVAGVQLALLAMQQKRDGLAYKLLKQVTKHHPNMPSAWSNLGVWWHTQARRSKGARQAHARRQALRAYLQAKAVGARAPQIDNGLALLYAASGQQARAVSHYQKALSGSRVPPVVALNYVRFLWKQGKRKQAHTLVRLWSRRFPRYRPYRRWLAKHMPTSLPTRP
jgi:Tfp pilus assembly protein PilF